MISKMAPSKKRIIGLLLGYLMLVLTQSVDAQTAKGGRMVTPDETQQGDIHALIIGISNYANYPSLQFADKDALAFYNLLLSDAFGADSNRIALLLNEQATQNRVDEALSNLMSFVKEGDRVFIHFSGHGGVEGLTTLRRGFLLTHETSPSNLRLSSYRIDDLNAIVGELATANKAQVFLVMDACHAGKVDEAQHKGISPVTEYLTRITYGTSFLSSGPDELSLEGVQWGGGRGLFSYHLVNGLAGKADMDEDGKVDLNEITFYVKNRVKKEADPNPQNPIINGKESTISMAAPDFLNTIQDGKTMQAQLAMRDVSSKGYEQLFLDKLSDTQKLIYSSFMQALDKSGCVGLACIDFSEAEKHFNELIKTTIPSGLEAILRRKLIASLQDKPQQLLDMIISDSKAYTNFDEVCQIVENLKHSASLLGKTHYLYRITMAKYYFFLSNCYGFNKNYNSDNSLKDLSLQAADSAILFVDDVHFFYNNKGLVLDDMNRHEDAIEMYDKAIGLEPDNANYYYNKGISYEKMNRLEEAINMYDKAIALNPDYASAYINKGNILFELKYYDEAIETYDFAITLKPKDASAYFNKGNALLNLYSFEEAIVMYDKAIALKPDNTKYYYNKGIALDALKRFEEAIDMYNTAIALQPDDADIYYNKGFALENLYRYEEAIEMYDKAIALNPNDADVYYNKGRDLYYLKRYEEAIEMFDKALALNSNDANAYYNKGNVLKELGQLEEAIAMYNKSISIQPDELQTYYNKGNALYELSRFLEAISAFDSVIVLDPYDAKAYYNKGNALFNLNRYEEAISMYDKVIDLWPEDASAYFNIGNALFNLNRYDETIVMFDKAIARNPDRVNYYIMKGTVLHKLKRFDDAVAIYKHCIEIDPGGRGGYFYNIGCAFSLMGNATEALNYLEQALQNGYNYFEWIASDTDWDSIRETTEFKELIKKYRD